MSSLRRFLSASAASWARILLTVATQLLLVPLYLSHWSVEEYGCWLIVQTLVSLGSLLSTGIHNYAGYEFLKIGDRQPRKSRRLFYSILPCLLGVSALELLVLCGLIYCGTLRHVFDSGNSLDGRLLYQSDVALLIYSIGWLITTSTAGLAQRAVAPYGHFPRMSWWVVLLALVQSATAAVAVALGADLLQTAVWINVVTAAANVPFHWDMWRIFREQELHPVKPEWRFGLQAVARSVALSCGNILDLSRQQGVRIFLGTLLGVTQMTEFSTTRTLSNLSMQGIGTVINPIMPELMRFLHGRDAQRTQAAIGFVWLLAVVLLSPLMVAFQWAIPAVYAEWTRGKLTYDPALFALFSAALLLFALARPPLGVLQGNNLLKVQLIISIIVSAVALGGILLVTPRFGTRGAAAALLVAELIGTVLAVGYCARWLNHTGIGFPWTLFLVSLLSMVVADVAIALMVWLPRWRLPILPAALALGGFIVVLFVKKSPPVAVTRVSRLLPISTGAAR
jgi:O-antigen/teichoic acid export membrane protein